MSRTLWHPFKSFRKRDNSVCLDTVLTCSSNTSQFPPVLETWQNPAYKLNTRLILFQQNEEIHLWSLQIVLKHYHGVVQNLKRYSQANNGIPTEVRFLLFLMTTSKTEERLFLNGRLRSYVTLEDHILFWNIHWEDCYLVNGS